MILLLSVILFALIPFYSSQRSTLLSNGQVSSATQNETNKASQFKSLSLTFRPKFQSATISKSTGHFADFLHSRIFEKPVFDEHKSVKTNAVKENQLKVTVNEQDIKQKQPRIRKSCCLTSHYKTKRHISVHPINQLLVVESSPYVDHQQTDSIIKTNYDLLKERKNASNTEDKQDYDINEHWIFMQNKNNTKLHMNENTTLNKSKNDATFNSRTNDNEEKNIDSTTIYNVTFNASSEAITIPGEDAMNTYSKDATTAVASETHIHSTTKQHENKNEDNVSAITQPGTSYFRGRVTITQNKNTTNTTIFESQISTNSNKNENEYEKKDVVLVNTDTIHSDVNDHSRTTDEVTNYSNMNNYNTVDESNTDANVNTSENEYKNLVSTTIRTVLFGAKNYSMTTENTAKLIVDPICYGDGCCCGINCDLSEKVTDTMINGCGPRDSYIRFLTLKIGDYMGFTSACNVHDICYGTCNNRRSQCDEDFLSKMMVTCTTEWNTSHLRALFCQSMANIFDHMVRTWGKMAFARAQKFYCKCSLT